MSGRPISRSDPLTPRELRGLALARWSSIALSFATSTSAYAGLLT